MKEMWREGMNENMKERREERKKEKKKELKKRMKERKKKKRKMGKIIVFKVILAYIHIGSLAFSKNKIKVILWLYNFVPLPIALQASF